MLNAFPSTFPSISLINLSAVSMKIGIKVCNVDNLKELLKKRRSCFHRGYLAESNPLSKLKSLYAMYGFSMHTSELKTFWISSGLLTIMPRMWKNQIFTRFGYKKHSSVMSLSCSEKNWYKSVSSHYSHLSHAFKVMYKSKHCLTFSQLLIKIFFFFHYASEISHARKFLRRNFRSLCDDNYARMAVDMRRENCWSTLFCGCWWHGR